MRNRKTHISNGELERVNLNIDILNMEHAARVLARARQMHSNSHTRPAKEHISKPRVLVFDRARLAVDVERNVAHVRLDLREGELEVVRVVVLDGVVGRELDVVVRVEGDDVGEDVRAFHRQVLDHKIHLIVGVLDTGNGLVRAKTRNE